MNVRFATIVLSCCLAGCAGGERGVPAGATFKVSLDEFPEAAMRFHNGRTIALMRLSADIFRETGIANGAVLDVPIPDRRAAVTISYALTSLNSGIFTTALRSDGAGNVWYNEPAHNDMIELDRDGNFAQRIVLDAQTSVADFQPLRDGSLVFSDRGTGHAAIRLLPKSALTRSRLHSKHGIVENPAQSRVQTLAALNVESGPDELAECADGSVWFIEIDANRVGRVLPRGGRPSLMEFSVPPSDASTGERERGPLHTIASDAQGTCWFTAGTTHARLFRIHPERAASDTGDGTKVFELTDQDRTESSGYGELALGPDRALWYAEQNANRIVRIDTRGKFQLRSMPIEHPTGMTTCGAWLCIAERGEGNVGFVRIVDPSGVGSKQEQPPATDIAQTSADPAAVVGDDERGRVWFAERDAARIGMIDTRQKKIVEYRPELTGRVAPGCAGAAGGRRPIVDPVRHAHTYDGIAVTRYDDAHKRNLVFLTEYANDRIATFDIDTRQLREYGIRNLSTNAENFAGPEGIAVDRDGNAWFTESHAGSIGEMTPCGALTEYPIRTPDSEPAGIALGADGAMWFTELSGNKIGRITAGGGVTEYTIPTKNSMPMRIVSGRKDDRRLWFTEYNGNKIGRISILGDVQEFRLRRPRSQPIGIAASEDGVWFVEGTSEPEPSRLGHLTPDGSIEEAELDEDPFDVAAIEIPDFGGVRELWITSPTAHSLLHLGF